MAVAAQPAFSQTHRMIHRCDGSRMSPRPYRLGRRAESIEQTRGRIIAASRDLLARAGYRSTSLEEVARAADVTRATVYYQFGSKAGLLEAVVGAIQRRRGQPHGRSPAA